MPRLVGSLKQRWDFLTLSISPFLSSSLKCPCEKIITLISALWSCQKSPGAACWQGLWGFGITLNVTYSFSHAELFPQLLVVTFCLFPSPLDATMSVKPSSVPLLRKPYLQSPVPFPALLLIRRDVDVWANESSSGPSGAGAQEPLLGNFSGWPTSLWHGTKVPLKDHMSLGDSFAAGRGGLGAHPTLAQPELPPVCRSQQAVGAVSGR